MKHFWYFTGIYFSERSSDTYHKVQNHTLKVLYLCLVSKWQEKVFNYRKTFTYQKYEYNSFHSFPGTLKKKANFHFQPQIYARENIFNSRLASKNMSLSYYLWFRKWTPFLKNSTNTDISSSWVFLMNYDIYCLRSSLI